MYILKYLVRKYNFQKVLNVFSTYAFSKFLMPIPGSFRTLQFCYWRLFLIFWPEKILSDYYEPRVPTFTATIGDYVELFYSAKDKEDEFQIKRFPENGEQATFGQTYTEKGFNFNSVRAEDEGFYTSSKPGQGQRYDGYTRLIVRGVSTESFIKRKFQTNNWNFADLFKFLLALFTISSTNLSKEVI